MSLKDECEHHGSSDVRISDAFPSSVAFDAINESLASNDADRKDAVKQGKAIFAFKLTNSSGKEEAWYIDLKDTGKVGKGEAPEGKKADGQFHDIPWEEETAEWTKRAIVTLLLSDENFGKLIAGKTKAQTLFMSGKLKARQVDPGRREREELTSATATKMEPILAKAGGAVKAKL
ncbi:uncharacterized protein A1O5_10544 [Cladophialophora psammophila CBS 110553]|uniref:SCP2 domain-containing protein n=1 Tax=Cladophialophora psammophila CBS 110553 TaxID=1182543 RepID=W9WE71_9EURO|nr:uncharacterized protein A1O5_10544 [Cladophialophora psammophila CBS 110553]EXJ66392.1 hypothetical protein A1O5_10544 [Cladophialophora psammophila CBS 110553]